MVDPEVSEGWSVDVDMPSNTLRITSPVDGDQYGTGTINLGLKSNRGLTSMYSANLRIVRPPVMAIDTDHIVTGWGTTQNISFTTRYVTAASIKTAPVGWTVEMDLANNRIQVTTPADGKNPRDVRRRPD